MAAYPWAIIAKYSGITQEELDKLPHLSKWIERIKARRKLSVVHLLTSLIASTAGVKAGCDDKYGSIDRNKVKNMFNTATKL